MSHQIDKHYFDQLGERDPQEVCRRTSSRFDPQERCYFLTVWEREYEISPERKTITQLADVPQPAPLLMGLFIILYLLKSKESEVSGQWISEKDMPGGVAFFSGPHTIPGNLIANRFGDDLEGFRQTCLSLGGAPLDMADAAFAFAIVPLIPVAVLLWRRDEEFPAEAKLLFDKTITEHLALDIIFGLTVEICSALAQDGLTPLDINK